MYQSTEITTRMTLYVADKMLVYFDTSAGTGPRQAANHENQIRVPRTAPPSRIETCSNMGLILNPNQHTATDSMNDFKIGYYSHRKFSKIFPLAQQTAAHRTSKPP